MLLKKLRETHTRHRAKYTFSFKYFKHYIKARRHIKAYLILSPLLNFQEVAKFTYCKILYLKYFIPRNN